MATVAKRRKLLHLRTNTISNFQRLPDDVIMHILSYLGTNVWGNGTDEEDENLQNSYSDNTKQKFLLSTVCRRFDRLLNEKASWKFTELLTITPKRRTTTVSARTTAIGIRINRVFFSSKNAPQALRSLLNVAPIKHIKIVNIIYWASNSETTIFRRELLDIFSKNVNLQRSVRQLTLRGFLNHINTRPLILWLCNNLPKLQAVDMTVPGEQTTDQTFNLKFENTQLTKCPLEKVTFSKFEYSPTLLTLFDAKRLKELVLKIQSFGQKGTETLVEISNKIAPACLQKLVITRSNFNTTVMFIDLNEWLLTCHPEALSSLHHLELVHVNIYNMADLPHTLTLFPRALSFLKIHSDCSMIGNRAKIFKFLSHLALAFFNSAAIQKGEITFKTHTPLDDYHFLKYRTYAHRQWEGIKVEENFAELANDFSYTLSKFGKSLDVNICLM